jgi:SpoVK/Ycf46/Vps4 family AAA+-type ATPase
MQNSAWWRIEMVAQMRDLDIELVHIARLAAQGRTPDVLAVARRAMRQLVRQRPDLAQKASEVLLALGSGEVVRAGTTPIPVDSDSRLELLRREDVNELPVEPVWADQVSFELNAVVEERLREGELDGAGLTPTRSLLLVGPPGTGKTLAARWLAQRLDRTLLTLDLASVMSSFLGRTGNNIRVVLEYATHSGGILLLDEFDAIAKRRDDAVELGELKRLVTVLLQAVDDWPPDGLLVAATNHPELLDPAVWRRFERVIRFPFPSRADIAAIIRSIVGPAVEGEFKDVFAMLAFVLEGQSGAEVVRSLTAARRHAVMRRISLGIALAESAGRIARERPLSVRTELARQLRTHGFSQRRVSDLTGLARDTVRRHEMDK